jgi:SAM-dependent methyltransferase
MNKLLLVLINYLLSESYCWVNPILGKANIKISEPSIKLLESYNEIRNCSLVYPDYIPELSDKLCWSNALTTNYFLNMTDVEASHTIKQLHIMELNKYIGTRGQRNNGRNITDILDIGCSFGNFTTYLKETFKDSRVVGVDISAHMLAIAKEQTSRDILLIHANAEMLPIEDNSFDMINIGYMCSTIPRFVADNIIIECSRILRPGGILSIIDTSPTSKDKNMIKGKYFEEYIYWCSRVPDSLIDAGFVSIHENSGIPEVNIKICWKSMGSLVKYREINGDYDNFIARRIKNKKPSIIVVTGSAITTVFFQLMVAFVYANLITTIYEKLMK